jgi:hypothetical protein
VALGAELVGDVVQPERKDLGHFAGAVVHLDAAGQMAADLHRVDDGLDQAGVMNGVGENSFAAELKALLGGADGSNLELEWHVFK